MQKTIFFLIAIVCIVLSGCDLKETKTDISTIKKHRISLLTDEKIREMWIEAEDIRHSEIREIEKKKSENFEKLSKKSELCNDDVYKVRNSEECNKMSNILTLQSETVRSKDQIFDAILLGVCNFIEEKDYEKLRKNNCIP